MFVSKYFGPKVLSRKGELFPIRGLQVLWHLFALLSRPYLWSNLAVNEDKLKEQNSTTALKYNYNGHDKFNFKFVEQIFTRRSRCNLANDSNNSFL